MKKLTILLTVLILLAAACGTSEPVITPTASAFPTELPTETRVSTKTPTFPAPTATPRPIEGTLTIKVNVRNGPGTSYDSLGLLDAGGKVGITFRNDDGKWYRIIYPAAPDGLGWVAAQYVSLAAGVEIPLDATPTPSGPGGRVMQRLNVRSGPGTTFDSLGMLEPDTAVSLTGKNSTASWFQIDYSAGPGGRGWVTAQYIQTDSAADLPVLDDYGTPAASSAAGPTSIPVTATVTVGPALADDDSSTAPAVRVTFSAGGTRQFTYSSQVSAPDGDGEDWIEFTPYAVSGAEARLTFSLTCSGKGTLIVELWQSGAPLSGWGTLACGVTSLAVSLPAGQVYQMRLAPVSGAGPRLVAYTLTVRNEP
jgi:uncharacterized protein YraI